MLELFELELVGGTTTARYRKARPEVEAMPWGTLRPDDHPPELLAAARKAWTSAAFQEFRTGAACAATLQALMTARAPLDLIAVAARFPLDEVVHVELCSRLASELGGGAPLAYDPDHLVYDPGAGAPPLQRAAHLVVHNFCVGEALSIPLLHGTSQAATHPLIKAVLRRIVVDEADHGTFGWTFLDWALPHLDDNDRNALGRTADRSIAGIHQTWADLRRNQQAPRDQAYALGWLGTDEYLNLAARSLESQVIAPLRQRGIPITAA
jgi:hypothetical protein